MNDLLRSESNATSSEFTEHQEIGAQETFFSLLTEAENASTPTLRQEIARRLAEFNESELSFSPNIFDDLSIEEQLNVATRFSRIPEAQGTIAQHLVGALTYNLEGMRNSVPFLEEYLHDLPIERQLDTLSYLATIGADAAAQGWANRLSDCIHRVVEGITKDGNANPFVRYAAEATLDRITEERADPRDVLITGGDRSVGRATVAAGTIMRQESDRLRRILQPDRTSYAESTFGRIARDAVASFDHSLTPQSFARFTIEEERAHVVDMNAPDPGNADRLAQFLAQFPHDSIRPRDIRSAIDFTDARLCSEINRQHRAATWHDIAPNVTQEQWEQHFSIQEKLRALQASVARHEQQRLTEAEKTNEQAAEKLVAEARRVIDALPVGGYPGLEEIRSELSLSDLERQYRAAENLALIGQYRGDATESLNALVKLREKTQRLQQKSFAIARQKTALFQERFASEMLPLLQQSREDEKTVLTPITARHLATYTTTLRAASPALDVSFAPLATLLTESGAKNFPDGVDVPRLLEELHRPEMRQRIETDMGVDLVELTLREQAQLLSFLTRSDNDTIKRTFALTQRFGTPAARMFVAGEYAPDIHSSLVTLLEGLEQQTADRLLGTYGDLLNEADALNATLHTAASWKTADNTNALFPDLLRDALEKRAKDAFIGLSREQDIAPPEHVIAAFEGIALMVRIIHGGQTQGERIDITRQEETPNRTVLAVTRGNEHYRLAITTRARHETQGETSAKGGGEARIAFELFFDQAPPEMTAAYTHVITKHGKKPQTRASLRLSIDRDMLDPLQPRVSLDVGRGGFADERMRVEGDVLGRLMDVLGEEGHHDRTTFPAALAAEPAFAAIVESFQTYIAQLGSTTEKPITAEDRRQVPKERRKSVA